MTTHSHHRNFTPPPPDESYWEALLRDGEFAANNGNFEHQHAVSNTTHTHEGSAYNGNGNENSYYNYNQSEADWQQIAQVMNSDQTIELTVVGYNRGGLLVEWRSLRGFVPASQLLDFPTNATPNARRLALIDRVGDPLLLRVIELDPEQNRLVLSERAAQVKPGERAQILSNLEPGDTITGEVTNITDFGVFIDLGGLEGLIHISELSWGRVGHPRDVVRRGEQVCTYVLDVNPDEGRIALSIKRLHPDPWETVEKRYSIGETITAHITNVVDFGAFACIEEGLEGLIHVSELAEGRFLHPRNVVEEGQEIKARILSIDRHARRLGLSMRAIDTSNQPGITEHKSLYR